MFVRFVVISAVALQGSSGEVVITRGQKPGSHPEATAPASGAASVPVRVVVLSGVVSSRVMPAKLDVPEALIVSWCLQHQRQMREVRSRLPNLVLPAFRQTLLQ